MRKIFAAACFAVVLVPFGQPRIASAAPPSGHPNILQRPAISTKLIAFGYAGDLWVVPRQGGRATRLTAGVGIESQPVFSPDGQLLAFTGEYDGNTDVYTIPVTGGIPTRITYHPAADFAVGWTPDGKSILFRSNRLANSRYTQLFTIPATGGLATPLPLPMAYSGTFSADGSRIAYAPLPPAFGFDFTNYTAWGNYRGGRAGTIWITTLPGLDSVEVPHEQSSDFSPVYVGDAIFFLSGRKGHIGVFRWDPATKAVTEIFHNTGTDIHSLATDGHQLIFDQLGELYLLEPKEGAKPQAVDVDVTADLPEVRPHLKNVAAEIEHYALSPSALRVAVEAHGEILTVAAKHGPVRNLTNSPGVMEREPAWSPDGQSVAFFSDAPGLNGNAGGKPGLYSLHIASQTGDTPVKSFALAPEPAYYFDPQWSPDSKHIAFHDNRLHVYVLDITTGKLSQVGEPNTFGGFSSAATEMAWSPDSKWLAYPHSMPNHLHALFLYSVDKGTSTQLTNDMADAHSPAFDRNGKFLYFLASNNQGATEAGLDMTSDVYQPTQSIYAITLAAKTASPVAPQTDDEKTPAEVQSKTADKADNTPAGEAGEARDEQEKHPTEAHPVAPVKPPELDLAGLPLDAIARRTAALPLPPRFYRNLKTGKPGTIYFLQAEETGRFGAGRGDTLNRWVLDSRKTEKLAEHVSDFQFSADGEKMLLVLASEGGEENEEATHATPPRMVVVPATAPAKPGEGAISFAQVEVHVDPKAEWRQMYYEVWNIERAYFYDAHFHGANTEALERQYEPYVNSIASRADLNYIFQEMLSAFSVGHLRGSGGSVPEAPKVPGGLLGADYVIHNGHYCLAKIYTGGSWSPQLHAPLAQPGLDIAAGDCILSIDNEPLAADTNIQQPLEGTAGRAITLHVAGPNGERPRNVIVVPIGSEAALRNTEWIDANQRKVNQLSGGKLAYVYLPDTAAGGFTNFNRYYFAQTNKQGAIIDERFNAGGQIADYIVEVLGRKLEAYWAPRYGAIEHTPNDAIYGPKVMIANEYSGSGGDAMPWLFKHNEVGVLVGKRTWGGLVGIGNIPVLMDGGNVTSPSVAFFSPEGKWDVENHGVDPDVDVNQDPKAVSEGHDPQLEKAVAVALEELAKHPNPEPHKPAYPQYNY